MFINDIKYTKNEAYNLFMIVTQSSDSTQPSSQNTIDNVDSKYRIKKDNGGWENCTNNGVFVGNGIFTLQLTAEEMNADVINIACWNPTVSKRFTVGETINTGITSQDVWSNVGRTITGGGTTVQSPAVMTSIAKAVNKGYIVSRIATGESGYNYYGLTNVKNPWWLIIQEKTDFSNVGYKMAKENRLSFNSSWTNRATLNYGEQFPLK